MRYRWEQQSIHAPDRCCDAGEVFRQKQPETRTEAPRWYSTTPWGLCVIGGNMERVHIGREEAVRRYFSNWWEGKSDLEIAVTQMGIAELCTPWSVFHGAVERALGRPVYKHEFGTENVDRLWEELVGRA